MQAAGAHRTGCGEGAGRPQLVLDVGGVLLDPFTRAMFATLVANGDGDAVHALWSRDIKPGMWTGRITADDFYAWMAGHGMTFTPQEARERIRPLLAEQAACGRLRDWAREADIHLMSNHLTEWLQEPLLDRYEDVLDCLAISDKVGARKPEEAIYRFVAEHIGDRGPVLYVDDKERNFPPARRLGWEVLLADPDGEWVGSVDQWLAAARDQAAHPGAGRD